MAGNPTAIRWAFLSFAVMVVFSVSVVGQGMRTSDEPPDHAGEIQSSIPMVKDIRYESGDVRTVRTPAPIGQRSRDQGDAAGEDKKDLTVFFVIGFIINILLISVFMFWAVGQWRKTKREE